MISVSLSGQQKTAPEFKLIEFQMALLKRFPREKAAKPDLTGSQKETRKDYVRALLESGKAMIAGPLTDDGDIRGIFIFEQRRWMKPAVGRKLSTRQSRACLLLKCIDGGPRRDEKAAASFKAEHGVFRLACARREVDR